MRHASANHRSGPASRGQDAGALRNEQACKNEHFFSNRNATNSAQLRCTNLRLARRDFFKVLGAGIAVFAIARMSLRRKPRPGLAASTAKNCPRKSARGCTSARTARVTGFTGKAEIGQNVRTTLAQTIADELRVPFDSVRMVMGDTALTPVGRGHVRQPDHADHHAAIAPGGRRSARSTASSSREGMERAGATS